MEDHSDEIKKLLTQALTLMGVPDELVQLVQQGDAHVHVAIVPRDEAITEAMEHYEDGEVIGMALNHKPVRQ